MLHVQALSKSFRLPRPKRGAPQPVERDPRQDGRWFHAVVDVSFTARDGAVVGLLGPNGAGKTTLLRVLSTALQPTKGTASFDGVDIVADPARVRQRLGFLSGNTGLYGRLTTHEMLMYFARLHGLDPARAAARIDELSELLDLRSFVTRRCDALSAGMKQRVSIARTLIHDPEIVVFDEPTTGLDVAAAETILRLIERCRTEGKTVLLSTHHMSEVQRLCDSVVLVHEGRVRFSGTVDEMRRDGGADDLEHAFLRLVDYTGVGAGVGDAA